MIVRAQLFQAQQTHPVEAGVSPAGVATKKIAAGTGVLQQPRIALCPGDDYITDERKLADRSISARDGRQKCYVDTGPMLSAITRLLASAGMAKHDVIEPRIRTWFFR